MRKASNKPLRDDLADYIATLPDEDQREIERLATDVVCGCGEVLAHADGADLVLHVWERSILRPHVLRSTDLPLTWNCPRCGVQSIIPAR